jgi:hypothetical protein
MTTRPLSRLVLLTFIAGFRLMPTAVGAIQPKVDLEHLDKVSHQRVVIVVGYRDFPGPQSSNLDDVGYAIAISPSEQEIAGIVSFTNYYTIKELQEKAQVELKDSGATKFRVYEKQISRGKGLEYVVVSTQIKLKDGRTQRGIAVAFGEADADVVPLAVKSFRGRFWGYDEKKHGYKVEHSGSFRFYFRSPTASGVRS